MNNQPNQDRDHLKILSICHYVFAGMMLFPFLYGMFYVVMGIVFGAAIASAPQQQGGPPPALFGGIFVVIGLVIAAIALVLGVTMIMAGRNLSKAKSYTFCFVIACISCIFMPFGTILGVFTIIVLMRESVKAMFNGQPYGQQFSNMPPPPNWQ